MNPPRLPQLAPRAAEGHKGDYGQALLIGGSPGMAGAIALSGIAALRSGAGLARLAVPQSIQATVAAFEPSYMTAPLACDEHGRISSEARERIASLAESASVVACGPGLGQSAAIKDLVAWLYSTLPIPLLLDADALNALADQPAVLQKPAAARILTPHPGEFRRLLEGAGQASTRDRQPLEDAACRMARDCGVVILLKGHRTLIADGVQSVHNQTGNPGMATGGAGDVLTGVIAALIGQGLAPFDAAWLGAHAHGLAGDLAEEELGEVSLIASDLPRFLPAAFRRLAAE